MMKNKQKIIERIQKVTGLLIFSDIIKEDKTGKDLRLALDTLNNLLAELFIELQSE